MELKIKVCTRESCRVAVEDLTGTGGKGYLEEDDASSALCRFRRSDTSSFSLLQHNKAEGGELQPAVFGGKAELPVKFDGWFTVMHVVLPVKAWFDREKAKEKGSILGQYETVYYLDGTDIYKYVPKNNSGTEKATVEEVVGRNTEGTTISKACEDYVSICFLRKCFISLAKEILDDRSMSVCQDRNGIDPDLLFRRDYVWMALNVIRYLVRFGQLAEAERIIESIAGCNGLCKDEFKAMQSPGCGCGR